jgi:hypothetical protein
MCAARTARAPWGEAAPGFLEVGGPELLQVADDEGAEVDELGLGVGRVVHRRAAARGLGGELLERAVDAVAASAQQQDQDGDDDADEAAADGERRAAAGHRPPVFHAARTSARPTHGRGLPGGGAVQRVRLPRSRLMLEMRAI